MYKIIPPDSWDFGVASTQLVKAAHDGLRGHDYSALIKRAGHELAQWVQTQDKPHDEEWVHGIIMGAHESSGQNRNADSWSSKNLQRDHTTFETHARAYRDHKNTDPAKSYGIIKKSWFNPEMKRVELIIAYNATPEAARRNGGLVADRELEKLASGKPLALSMGCSVPHDVCALCNKHSKTRAEYCDEHSCTYLGMKKHAGRVYDDGAVQYVDNPNSTFRDCSHVARGADRTAFVLGKVAAAGPNQTVTGAELAELLGISEVPLVRSPLPTAIAKLAQEMLHAYRANTGQEWALSFSPPAYQLPKLAQDLSDSIRLQRLRALADLGVVLPVRGWLELTTGIRGPVLDKAAAAVATTLQSEYPDIQDHAELPGLVRLHALQSVRVSDEQRKWASTLAPLALDAHSTRLRLYKNTLSGVPAPTLQTGVKVAAYNPGAQQSARHYLAYALGAAALCQDKTGFALMPKLLIVQNRLH